MSCDRGLCFQPNLWSCNHFALVIKGRWSCRVLLWPSVWGWAPPLTFWTNLSPGLSGASSGRI